MTKSINFQRWQERMDISYNGPADRVFLGDRDSVISAEFISLETEVCLAYARLLDDPQNNNIDCPWDWKNQDDED